MHTNIINSSKTLNPSDSQEELLNKGLTFVPTPRATDMGNSEGTSMLIIDNSKSWTDFYSYSVREVIDVTQFNVILN